MDKKQKLYGGFAKIDITPPEPEGMTLMGMPRPFPGARGILDPLYARACYLECGGETFLMIVCDNVAPRVMYPEYLGAVDALSEFGGIKKKNIWVVSTHCHSSTGEGPGNPYLKKVNNRYVINLVRKLVKVGKRAVKTRQRVQIAYAEGPVEKVGTSRRVKLSDGVVATGWGDGPSPPPGVRIVGRGPHDKNVDVAIFKTMKGKPVGALVNYNSHVHGYPILYFSSELAGATCRRLERQFPALTAVFTVGAEGDVALSESLEPQSTDPSRWNTQYKREMKRMSTVLVDRIQKLYKSMAFEPLARMDTGDVILKIPNSETGEAVEHIWAVAVNGLALVGEVEEMFVEFALRLKDKSPFKSTFVVGLKDIRNFYFPTAMGMEEGGHESKLWIKPGSLDRVIDASAKLLGEMHRKGTA